MCEPSHIFRDERVTRHFGERMRGPQVTAAADGCEAVWEVPELPSQAAATVTAAAAAVAPTTTTAIGAGAGGPHAGDKRRREGGGSGDGGSGEGGTPA